MNYQIREAVLSDAKRIAVILRAMDWFPHMNTEPLETATGQVRRQLALCLADDSHSIYVAEDATGELAGYIAIHWLPYLIHPGPEGYVSELFVREARRGQGLGAKLLNAAVEEGGRRGCFRLALLNNRRRESYRRGFYKKQGWQERPDLVNFIYMMVDREACLPIIDR